MQFLKTIFWTLLAVIAAIFAYQNWTAVSVNLWNGIILDTKLPLLLLVAFLIGLLPTYLLHRATRWNLSRKLDNTKRELADIRAPLPVEPTNAPISAAPSAVPGVS